MNLAQKLNLTKPLVMIDLETTGAKPSIHRICQVGIIKIYPDGTEKPWETLVNPGIHIPKEMTDIHGINDKMVEGAPTFSGIASILIHGLEDCYIGGYNVQFDMGFLEYEFYRIAYDFDPDEYVLLDGFDIFRHFNPRDLTAAVKYYLNKELNAAHHADIDIRATKEVIEAQLHRHSELPHSIEEIQKLVQKQKKKDHFIDRQGKLAWVETVPIINFGKHADKPLDQVPKQYLRWIAYEAEDFSPKVKRVIIKALAGEYPVRKNNG